MDLLEKLYQKIAQREVFKKKSCKGTLRLRDVAKYLDVFVNSFCRGPSQFQPVASREYVGLYGAQIFLPEAIDYFDDINLNKLLYKNLILQIMGAHGLSLHSTSPGEPAIVQRLKFLEHGHTINLYLDGQLAGYRIFQAELMAEVSAVANLRNRYDRQVFKDWAERALARASSGYSVRSLIDDKRSQDTVPRFLFFTVPGLEQKKSGIQKSKDYKIGTRQKKVKVESEIEKTYSGINQDVNLEKEKANPVMHSFEKLETVDEYSGGRKVDSGDDELGDHAKALDELNLTKVTRGGEAVKSVFNADASIDFDLTPIASDQKVLNEHFYPEWNYKKNHYMRDHCHLIANPLAIELGDGHFKKVLQQKNRYLITRWRARIQSLFSEPLWVKKLTEGEEIDIDEVIRDVGLIVSRQNISARWYTSRRKQLNDVEVVILFDQSHSSDSWVKNRRVLDICLEAVGTAGLLFDQIFEAVTVAGVWSSTRHNCSFQIYKNNYEPWTSFFGKKEAIRAQGYTRLGPSIRHATALLKKSTHKKKLILLLTDGKPTDIDGYEGPSGINDVAQACREAELSGILHYAIILDQKQKAHFSKMFKHYVVLHEPKHFGEELFKILFRLIKA